MSNIDKHALREAAEKAGSDEWFAFIDTKSKTYSVHTPGDNRCGDVVKWAGFDGQKRAADKARFIAAANPATVLALLDELEASQSENKRLAKTLIERNGEPVEGLVKRVAELEEIATDYGMKFQRAQDALKHQSLLHKTQMEAAEKRIAELEAKLETADKLQDSAFRHGLQYGFSLGQTDNQAGFEECLSAYGTGKGE